MAVDLRSGDRREVPIIVIPGRILAPGRAGRQATMVAGLSYLQALWRAGAREWVVAPRALEDDEDADAILRQAHGLLLLAGSDVDPQRYGQAAHRATYGVDPVQDHFETALLAAAGRRSLPVLAICRGLQLVNVAFGGTLIQHLADEPGLLAHASDTFPRAEPGSIGPLLPVTIKPGCRLHRLVGSASSAQEPLTVLAAHSHHQAVDTVGQGLVIVGRSADGVVEALEHREQWLVATQYHPEDTAEIDPTMQQHFNGFVAEAATRMRP